MKTHLLPKFLNERDPERGIKCKVCISQCDLYWHCCVYRLRLPTLSLTCGIITTSYYSKD